MRARPLLLLAALGATGCSCGSQAAQVDATAGAKPVEGTPPKDALHAAIDAAAPAAAKPPARVEHAVFHFVPNRHAAHRLVDNELVIDGGVGLARYMKFGLPVARWHAGRTIDGEKAALADRSASLEVPLSAEQVKDVTHFTARVHGKAKQLVTLKVNGRKASDGAKAELVDGWQTVTLPIAADRLAAGENQIVLETGGKAGSIALAWARFGRARDTAPDPRTLATFDATKETITLAKNAGLAWYFMVPEGGHLVAEVGGAGCKVEVKARASDDSFAGGLLGRDSDRVDLTKMAGKAVALTLTARECASATIAKPQITLHGPQPKVGPQGNPPKYVVLWIMDALRADKIPTFQPGARALTPNFDELAKSAVVFRQHYVQGNESKTSHASIWTGLYPAVHKIRMAGPQKEWRLDKSFPLIAQQLEQAGFHTSGLTGNGNVNEGAGYHRGFKDFRNMMRETGVANGIIFGEKIVGEALKRLDKARANPTYLYFGTIDTHGPWIARKPWIDIYSPPPYHGPFQEFGTAKDLGIRPDSMGCHKIPPMRDIERLRAIYESAISYQDRELGRFIAQLKSWGIWDQTMLIISADHGEEMFEDGRCNHGGSLRDSLVRVPLVVYDPPRMPGGTIVEEGVDSVDIYPTIMEALGKEAPASLQGRSLVPLAQGVGRGWAQPSYASMYEWAHTMRIGRWKIRVGKTAQPMINDLVADVGEMIDFTKTATVERRMLTDNLGLFLATRKLWKKKDWGVTTNVTPTGAAALDQVQTP